MMAGMQSKMDDPATMKMVHDMMKTMDASTFAGMMRAQGMEISNEQVHSACSG